MGGQAHRDARSGPHQVLHGTVQLYFFPAFVVWVSFGASIIVSAVLFLGRKGTRGGEGRGVREDVGLDSAISSFQSVNYAELLTFNIAACQHIPRFPYGLCRENPSQSSSSARFGNHSLPIDRRQQVGQQ